MAAADPPPNPSPQPAMRSEENAGVTVAQPGEISPLQIGDLVVDPPVVLAPMAGITNAPFRTLCREFSQDRCLYVSEMITARAFVEGHARTLQLASFGEDEKTRRSIQLYGTNPDTLAQATKVLAEEWGVHHIDMNFGCPVRKVTAAGGGSAGAPSLARVCCTAAAWSLPLVAACASACRNWLVFSGSMPATTLAGRISSVMPSVSSTTDMILFR